jgi:hypothetical protein
MGSPQAYEKRQKYRAAMGINTNHSDPTAKRTAFLSAFKQQQQIQTSMQLLSKLTLFQMTIIHHLSKLLNQAQMEATPALSASLEDSQLIEMQQWFFSLFSSQHRGIRECVLRGMTCLAYTEVVRGLEAKDQPEETKDRAWFTQHIDSVVQSQVSLITEHSTSRQMYTKKADSVALITCLLPLSTNVELRKAWVDTLLSLWDDVNSIVRKIAIAMVKYLGRIDYPELEPYIHSQDQTRSSILMHQIIRHVKNPHYREKDQLNDLLQFFFA